ncbi:MAG: hypothetical protein SNJ74_05520 [Fimbriimonadaceae bacterium]
MTSRERLVAASRGGPVDRQPVVGFGGAGSDGVVCESPASLTTSDQVRLVPVANPLGRALAGGVDLNELHRRDPEKGAAALDAYVAQTRAEIEGALDSGADGIVYAVFGAHEAACTPMQYGGFYLERDREILAEFQDAVFNLVFVVAEPGVQNFIDFVSDLPAHAFGWDPVASGFSVEQVRALRNGALAVPGGESTEIALSGDWSFRPERFSHLSEANR